MEKVSGKRGESATFPESAGRVRLWSHRLRHSLLCGNLIMKYATCETSGILVLCAERFPLMPQPPLLSPLVKCVTDTPSQCGYGTGRLLL